MFECKKDTSGSGSIDSVITYDAATGALVGISTDSEINGKQVVDQLLTYSWDGYGNLEQRCDVNRSLAENVTHDDLNRFTGSTVYTGVSVSGNTCVGGSTTNSLSVGYDAMGNIQSKSNVGSTYKYDPNHPYAVDTVQNSSGTTVYSASYDNDGNMTTRNGSLIQWSVDNLPTSIASGTNYSTFSYGPDRDRYYQSAYNGVTTDTTYVGGLFELVSTSAGTTEYRHNIVADGQVIAVHTIDGNGAASTSYLHYDHLGSVDAITDDSGNVIQSMSFDAFGLRRDATNWDYDLSENQIATLKDDTDRGYTFQEQLDNVGLVHMNGRVYDPLIGRFISADPTVPAPFYSQAFNRYSYVYNSPLEFTDPSGFDPCPSDQIHCPYQQDSPGQQPPPETGSHIPGVDTGATCSGNCGGWNAMGPGPGGPGNGNEGSGPNESDPSSGENSNPASNANTAQLGKIQVTGVRLPTPPQQPYFTVNPFNNIWSYFLFSYSSPNAFLEATPKGYSRLAIRGLEIGNTGINLPILSTQQEDLILEEAVSLSNPVSSLFSSQDFNIFSDDDGFLHADIFSNNGGPAPAISGFFDSPANGNVGPDREYLQYNNISDFIFGPLIPSSQINFNPSGFGPGSYNLINHNCETYIRLCTLGPGG